MKTKLRNKLSFTAIVFAVLMSVFAIFSSFGTKASADFSSAVYYVVLDGFTPEGNYATVNGNRAYELTENDGLYVSGRYFVKRPGYSTSYTVYSYDDGNYSRAAFGTVEETDAGWYNFVYDKNRISGSNAYADLQERDFGDWYSVNTFNSFMYGTYGDVWLDKHSKMTLVTSSDPEYTRAYTQYYWDFTVSEEELEYFGDIYIAVSNGKEFYRNGDEYFIVNAPGSYRAIFSERRLYEGNVHVQIIDKDDDSPDEENAEYYLCLSTQNYAVTSANRLAYAGGGEYTIDEVVLSDSVKFYVADKNGSRWYSSSGDEMRVNDDASASYDIKFSPDKVYSGEGEWEKTDCHITYKLHSPESYDLDVSGEKYPLTYNAYNSSYDLYYNSRIYLYSGDVLSVEGFSDSYTVASSGYYRVLFTDGNTTGGDYYCFDKDGNYGTGDDYSYNLYVEKAPSYYAVFPDGINAGSGWRNKRTARLSFIARRRGYSRRILRERGFLYPRQRLRSEILCIRTYLFGRV